MTVRLHITFPGVDQEQFDAVHKIVTAGEPPKGLLFHSSAPSGDDWVVIDFWESRQDFEAAMPDLQKGIESAGVTLKGLPSVEEFPVYECSGA